MNRHLIAKVGLGGAIILAPIFASAQRLSNIQQLAWSFADLIKALLPILVTIALLVFFWGLIKYIRNAGTKPEEASQGKNIMIYGVIALFVMVSVWGLVGFIGDALGIREGGTISVPGVDPRPGGFR